MHASLRLLSVALCLFAFSGIAATQKDQPAGKQDKPEVKKPCGEKEIKPGSEKGKQERFFAFSPGKLVAPKVFHIAGIREVPRNARGDLILTAGELTFQQGKKQRLLLPFDRIQRVQFLAGDRNYEKAAYGAAVATLPIGGIGALLILKKHKVATFVFDYLNERGGRMGLVIQMEVKDGSACKEWMSRFGVSIEEPAPAAATKKP
jgi:hypothetical protein